MAGRTAQLGWSARWGRWLRRHRRWLAAVSAAGAVVALGLALQPPRAATVAVVVAATDLATGTRLAAEDVAVTEVAELLAPPGSSADPADLVGQVLGAPVSHGEPLTRTRLVADAAGAWAGPAGTAPVPVRFSDGDAARLLAAGQRIDVLAASGSGVGDGSEGEMAGDAGALARRVAQDVLVLAVTGAEARSAGLLSGGPVGDSAVPLVILAATPEQVVAIVGAQAADQLSFALVSSR